MAYTRKTRDIWIVESRYNGGWNYEAFADNPHTARAIAREYHARNPGLGVRVEKRRWPAGFPVDAIKEYQPVTPDRAQS